MKITAYVNAVNIFKLNPKVGCCLAARDWKGFGTRWNYMNGVIKNDKDETKAEDYAIRRLTPKEYYRLQGMKDEDYSKIEGKISDTQQYKIAGNGLTVDVIGAIFKEML